MNISLSPFAPENLVSRDKVLCRRSRPASRLRLHLALTRDTGFLKLSASASTYHTVHRHTPPYATIHRHTPPYTTIRHHTPTYAAIHHHTPSGGWSRVSSRLLRNCTTDGVHSRESTGTGSVFLKVVPVTYFARLCVIGNGV